MISAKEWNEKQKELRSTIYNEGDIERSRKLLMELHAEVSEGMVYRKKEKSNLDFLYEDLPESSYRIMPTKKDVTIAWNLWHITRIEDITMSILVLNKQQILDKEYLRLLDIEVTDTGNAMTDEEIIDFSEKVNIEELKKYRNAVAEQSKKFLMDLTYEDLKRKFSQEQVRRIIAEKAVTEHEDSLWLAEFWGKKDVGGILLLPLTRHQNSHINDSLRLKKGILK